MNRLPKFLLALCCSVFLLAPLTVSAQEQPADPRATVLQAFARLGQDGNYEFTDGTTQEAQYVGKKGSYSVADIYAVTGKVGQNSDSDVNFAYQNGSSLTQASGTDTLYAERILLGKKIYWNLQLTDTSFASDFKINSGWWRYVDLLHEPDLPASSLLQIVNMTDFILPGQFHFDDTTVQAADVVGTDTIKGVETTIYGLTVNSLAYLLEAQASPRVQQGNGINILKNSRLLAAMTVSINAQIWVGATDGKIYRLEWQNNLDIPYAELSGADSTYDDYTLTTLTHITVTYPVEPVLIQAPEDDLINSIAAS